MTKGTPRILVFGYGDVDRLDDGLGPVLAEAVERACLPGVTVDFTSQLCLEDAITVAAHDVVIFARGSDDCQQPFLFSRMKRRPQEEICGTGTLLRMTGWKPVPHQRRAGMPTPQRRQAAYPKRRFSGQPRSPNDLVELAWRLFRAEPQCHLLAVRGYEFDGFGERLSARAAGNLERAVAFLEAAIRLKLAVAPTFIKPARNLSAPRASIPM